MYLWTGNEARLTHSMTLLRDDDLLVALLASAEPGITHSFDKLAYSHTTIPSSKIYETSQLGDDLEHQSVRKLVVKHA